MLNVFIKVVNLIIKRKARKIYIDNFKPYIKNLPKHAPFDKGITIIEIIKVRKFLRKKETLNKPYFLNNTKYRLNLRLKILLPLS